MGDQGVNYSLHGVEFEATDEAAGAFLCFDPERPEGNDVGPYGMIEEMKSFLKVTDGMEYLVDIGALFGIYSLMFTRNRKATAYAIEPSPWAFPILQEQCALNPDRKIVPIQALAGERGGPDVRCTRDWQHVVANLDKPGAEDVVLPQVAIDDMGIERCDVMKIDVEAFECQVLRGARELIARCRPVIFLEVHFGNLPDNGESRQSLWDLLAEYKYRVKDFQGNEAEWFDEMKTGGATRVLCWPKALDQTIRRQ